MINNPGQNFQNPKDDSTLNTSLLYGGATFLFVLAAFFVLNYFNILSLSEVFPKALGWLPRQQVSSRHTTPATSSKKNSKVFNPIFKSQTAQIEGTIDKIEGSTLTISSGGNTDKFTLDDSVVVYHQKKGDPVLKPAGGKDEIETNKPATINLQVINNDFKVVSIIYR